MTPGATVASPLPIPQETTSRRLRMAFVLNALSTGGAEIHTVGLARALADLGHDCRLMPLLDHAQIDPQGLEVATVGGNGLFSLSLHRRLADMLDRSRPDVIVAVNGRPAACVQLARLAGRAQPRPVATVYHTTRLLDLRQKIQHGLHMPFINRSDALVFVSRNQQAYCERHAMQGRRNLTIHNGIDPSRYHAGARAAHRDAMRARLGLGPQDYVIGQSAVFRPEKNHAQSLEALAALRARGLQARLLLLGDGPGRAAIEAQVQSLGLADAVILAGRQADVVPWLSAFDVGILTSTAIETFSLAALEFMALGIPAVISEIGGASEMVTPGGNGCLFPVGDTPALVSALEALADPEHRLPMGREAARRVAADFTRDAMVGHYDRLFMELAG